METSEDSRPSFSFTTELDGDILRCTIKSEAENQTYACYLLYRKNGVRTIFHKDRRYSPEMMREFDLSKLLPPDTAPGAVNIQLFARNQTATCSRHGQVVHYPPLKGPKVPVIIPVYNAARYLPDTLPCLAAQDYENVEFIFVDDGSTDNSLALLRDFAKRDSRAQIFRQKHQFAGVARNLGMEHAAGKYLLFLDADDWFSPRLISETVFKAEDTNADIVVFPFERYDNVTHEKTPMPWTMKKALCPKDAPTFSRKSNPLNLYAFTTPSPCKLFRRNFISENGFLFQGTENSNDAAFTYAALALAERIAPLNEVLLTYRYNNEQSTQGRRDQAPIDFLNMLLELKRRLQSYGVYEEAEFAFLRFALQNSVGNLELLHNPDSFQVAYKALKQFGISELGVLQKPEDYYPKNSAKYYRKATAILRYSEREYAELYGLSERYFLPVASRHSPFAQISKTQPKISVIIPVYNTAQYLRECLDSVTRSTMREIEIICVNDGSTDESLSVLMEYQSNDERILVFHSPENQGLSLARNVALDNAKGEYVCCVDSDDWIEADEFEKTYAYAKKYDLDMLFFDAVPFYENKDLEETYASFKSYYTTKVDLSFPRTGQQMLLDTLRLHAYRTSMCLQLLKREYLSCHNLRFYPHIFYEDTLLMFRKRRL